jgi:hypothetical protein
MGTNISKECCAPIFAVKVSGMWMYSGHIGKVTWMEVTQKRAKAPEQIILCPCQWEHWHAPVRCHHVTTHDALNCGSHSSEYGGSCYGTLSAFCPFDSNATFKEQSSEPNWAGVFPSFLLEDGDNDV